MLWNPGFENWQKSLLGDTPEDWETALGESSQESTLVLSGEYALRLASQSGQPGGKLQQEVRPALPEGLRLVRIGPAVMKMGQIESADYRLTVPAGAAAALDAYNAAGSVPVEKKTKSGKKQLELKTYIPAVNYTQEGDSLVFTLHLPAGDKLNVSPALLLSWLEQAHGVPAWQCHVLRTGLFAAEGRPFL